MTFYLFCFCNIMIRVPLYLLTPWHCLFVCLSHSCTLLKPFDGFRCHLAGTLVASNDTLCSGSSWPQGKGRFWGLHHQPKYALQPNRQSYVATWRIQTSSSSFCEIAWFLLTIITVTNLLLLLVSNVLSLHCLFGFFTIMIWSMFLVYFVKKELSILKSTSAFKLFQRFITRSWKKVYVSIEYASRVLL